MKKEIYSELYNSRMLKDNNEIEVFEQNLELLSKHFTEEDIIELCTIFEDNSRNAEVMFSAIHLLETLSSEKAFENTIKGVVEMSYTSPEWANIIIYRCLNDIYAVQMIKQVKNRLDARIRDRFEDILFEIKNEDERMFGKAIDIII